MVKSVETRLAMNIIAVEAKIVIGNLRLMLSIYVTRGFWKISLNVTFNASNIYDHNEV